MKMERVPSHEDIMRDYIARLREAERAFADAKRELVAAKHALYGLVLS